uniref:Receptor-interacting serine/threonine-protein kinase 2 n=1 Tax=Pyxicephalus adspersus TaxID=30357 RepID=A0AAV3AMD9_PYXAD|nr:TPA: hypothetical protein GDO54_011848 [Pyxicephalus adspersus]
MSSGSSSQESGCCSPGRYQRDNLYQETANISSNLQLIPYTKLTDLTFINKGAYGTVYKALHSNWRIPVALKFFPKERHLMESERNKIFKEAEILHKARFSYILPILGICYEEENIGIVTEYMTNGSLNQLLHEENPSPEIAWPIRFRILYEIALGVNFLHNLTPPLLHHDLKTQNILLDSEFHVKIADFGLSKWRMLSQSFSDHKPAGGTIIYMPPEMYEPNLNTGRGSVKHDMYSYAIIMWEVLSRKQPYEGATTPMQIMFSVAKGNRPDLSEESIPSDTPYRDMFISLMQSGWACDPNDRPAFLKCLLDLEPVIQNYDDISILEGILQIKRIHSRFDGSPSFTDERPQQESPSTALMWVLCKRDQIVNQMTDACLYQCLDALISNQIILKEDYELIKSERTRSAKVRGLIDTCEMQGESFARIIVQKLKDNRQKDLQPFPDLWQDG